MGRSKRQNLARSRNAARDVTAEETRPPCSDEVQAYRNLLFKKSMCLHPANAPVIRSCGVVEIPGKGRGLVARRHFCEGEKIFEVQCWVRGESSGEILSNVLRRRWAEGGAKARYFNEMVLGMWCWRAKETRTPQQIWDDAQIESEAARLAPDLYIVARMSTLGQSNLARSSGAREVVVEEITAAMQVRDIVMKRIEATASASEKKTHAS